MRKNGLFLESLHDGGKRIFELYGLICDSPNTKQRVPYRTDNSPSLTIRYTGKSFQFCDWSTDTKGDAIAFLQAAHSISVADAIKRARQIYGITAHYEEPIRAQKPDFSHTISAYKTKTEKGNTNNPEPYSTAAKTFLEQISFRSFSPSELRYWSEKTAGLVTQHILEKFNVRSTDSNSTTTDHERKRFSHLSHYFAFPSSLEGYYKILTPKRATTSGKRQKSFYLSTAKADRSRHNNKEFRYSFALDKLTSPVAYLCEGEADTLALLAAGFQAFTFGGVTSSIRDSERAELASLGVKRIVTVFDTDNAGRTAAKKLAAQNYEEFDITSLTLPKLSGSKSQKDVCDYLTLYGLDDELIQELVSAATSLCSGTITRRGTSIPTTDIRIERFIDEAAECAIVKALNAHKKLALIAPTGSGKTTTAVSIARLHAKSGERVVIALPTTIAVDQLGHAHDIHYISSTSGLDELSIRQAAGENIVITTWDSIKYCGNFDVLIVDEVHQIAKDRTYRASAVRSIFDAIKATQKVLAMTATIETLLCSQFGFHAMRCLSKAKQTIDVSFRELHDQIRTTVRISKTTKRLTDSVSWVFEVYQRGGIPVLRAKDKKLLSKIKKALELLGVSGIYSITSDDKSRGNSHVFESIKTTQCLPTDCRVLLCTNCIDTAVNIRGTAFELAILDERSADDIAQFAARFRDMNTIHVALFFAQLKHESPSILSVSDTYTAVHKIAYHHAELFNSIIQYSRDRLHPQMQNSRSFAFQDATFLASDGTYHVSEDYCYSHAVLDTSEKTAADTALVLAGFSESGVAHIRFRDTTGSSQNCIAVSQEASVTIDAANNVLLTELLSELSANPHKLLRAFYDHTRSSSVKADIIHFIGYQNMRADESDCEYAGSVQHLLQFIDAEKILRGYLQDVSDGFSSSDALILASRLAGSNSRTSFKHHLTNVQRINAPDDVLFGKQLVEKRELERIVAAFTAGEKLSGKDIAARIAKATKNYHIAPKNAVSLAKALFCAKRSGRAKQYLIGDVCSVTDYCTSYGVAPPMKSLGDTSPVIINAYSSPVVSPASAHHGISVSCQNTQKCPSLNFEAGESW